MACLAAYGLGLRACMEVTFSEKFGKSLVILEHFFDFFQNRPEMCLGGSGGTEGTPGDPWEPLNCSETLVFPGFRGVGNFP